MTVTSMFDMIDTLQNTPTLLIIAGTLAIMSLTIAASAYGSITTRSLYLTALAFAALALYTGLDDLSGDYFLNLGTEIIGALLMVVILSDWVFQYRWTFLVVAGVILIFTVTIEIMDDITQPFMINITTELLGAFLLLILLQRRDWIWNSGKRKREKRIHALRLERDREVTRRKDLEKEALMDEIETQLDKWREKEQSTWDIGMVIAGESVDAVKNKLNHLNQIVRIVDVRKDYEDADIVQCYVICSLRDLS